MNPLRKFHNIVSDQSIDYDDKIEELLKFGLELFQLKIGIISRIKNDDYEIIYTVSDVPDLKPGLRFDVKDTYCIHTLSAEKATGFHHAGQSEIANHPCYVQMKLEAYLGAPIIAGGELYGTVNFSSPEAVKPFDGNAYDYVELIAQWIGAEVTRERAIQKLNSQAETLKQLEKVGQIGTWEVDLLSNKIHWSDQTRNIHEAGDDFTPQMDTAIEFYKKGDSRKNITEAVETAIAIGKPWHIKAQIITMKGKERWVETKGEVEYQNGIAARLFGTFQDITGRVAAAERLREAKERAEKATQIKSHFLANMSHEIRTPMNGIMGTLQLLANSDLNSKHKKLVKTAHFSASNLLTIINDILDYSKIEADSLKLEKVPFSMCDIVDSVINDFDLEADKKNIGLSSQIDDAYEDGWEGDPVRVRQILLNLVSNAIKFTHSGEVKISVANQIINGKRACHLQVRDTGVGMSQEVVNRVFERFEQADSSTTRNYGGTGLGMSITRSLLALMGGRITIESEAGSGTCIDVLLPLAPVTLSTKSEKKVGLKVPNLASKHILLAEDNMVNQEILKAMLEATQVNLDIVEDGEAAIDKFKDKDYDLVLMDIQMPKVDGVTAYKALQKHNDKIPVIALTANVISEDVKKYKDMGFAAHISKPVDMDELFERIDAMLSKAYS